MTASITHASFLTLFLLPAVSGGCHFLARGPAPQAAAQIGPPPEGQLPDTATPLAYALELHIDPEKSQFGGHVRIGVNLHKSAQSLFVHGQGLEVEAATATPRGGEAIRAHYQQVTADGVARLDFDAPLDAGYVTLSFTYRAQFNEHLAGLYLVRAAAVPYVFSQFEPLGARRAFPCFDEPRFKAPFEVSLIVPADAVAVSNTPLLGEQRSDEDNGRKIVSFQPTAPLPTYLLNFSVGPFDVVDGPPVPASSVRREPLPLRGIAVRGQGTRLHYALQRTGAIVRLIEEYVGLQYPFSKLDVIAVPDFAAGAMENAGAITFRDGLLLLDDATASQGQRRSFVEVMAHELAHQWFGDLVTMAWWDDLWLNESFATWLASRTTYVLDPSLGIDADTIQSIRSTMRLDSLKTSRAVRQPTHTAGDIEGAFDSIVYGKGAGILRMFESHSLGPERMQSGVGAYLQAYQFGTANAAAFLRSLSQAAQADIAPAFATFIDQPGVPQIDFVVECTKTGNTLTLQQARYKPIGGSAADGLWQIPVCWRSAGSGPKADIERRCTLLSQARQTEQLRDCPKWLMPNAAGAGYYRWRMPPAALARLQLAPLTTLEQLDLVDNLVSMYEAAQLTAADVLPMLGLLATSRERSVAMAPMAFFHRLSTQVVGTALQPTVTQWLRALYGPAMHELGLVPRHHESTDDTLLRRGLAVFLTTTAEAPDLRRELAAAGKAIVGSAEDHKIHLEAIDPDLVTVAMTAAANLHGEAYTAELIDHLHATGDPALRRHLVDALAALDKPELAVRVRDLVLNYKLRANELWTLLAQQMRKPFLQEAAWEWFKSHYAVLLKRLPHHQLGKLPHLAGAFCDAAAASDVKAFFHDKLDALPGGERALSQALEEIGLCSALVAEQRRSTEAFFQAGSKLKDPKRTPQ